MSLVGLLRREGPLTATQAAAHLGESVPSCSFHLRQLAKYGLAERVPGADGRERPWRATAMTTSWDDHAEDPGVRAASRQLSATQLDHYAQRGRDYLARLDEEPADWQRAAGFGDAVVYVTADELAALRDRLDEVVAEYDERLTDRSARPPGSRPVAVVQLLFPMAPTPPGPAAGTAP
jgi:predicted ArsR family transcriptional regulator